MDAAEDDSQGGWSRMTRFHGTDPQSRLDDAGNADVLPVDALYSAAGRNPAGSVSRLGARHPDYASSDLGDRRPDGSTESRRDRLLPAQAPRVLERAPPAARSCGALSASCRRVFFRPAAPCRAEKSHHPAGEDSRIVFDPESASPGSLSFRSTLLAYFADLLSVTAASIDARRLHMKRLTSQCLSKRRQHCCLSAFELSLTRVDEMNFALVREGNQ